MQRRHVLAVVLLLLTAPAVRAEAPRGSFGFTVAVDVAGFLDSTVKSVTVRAVAPGMPAAAAGISPNDRIVEADGHAIVGAKAEELEPVLKKKVGDSVRLRLVRPDGAPYAVTLVAVERTSMP